MVAKEFFRFAHERLPPSQMSLVHYDLPPSGDCTRPEEWKTGFIQLVQSKDPNEMQTGYAINLRELEYVYQHVLICTIKDLFGATHDLKQSLQAFYKFTLVYCQFSSLDLDPPYFQLRNTCHACKI